MNGESGRSIRPATHCPCPVEDVAVVRAGDGALELAEAEGQPRAAVRAPVAEGDDGAGLVAKEDEVVAEHLQVHGLAAHLPGLDGRVPVLPESQPGAVVERPDLRGAVGLLHGALRHPGTAVRAARRVHEGHLPCRSADIAAQPRTRATSAPASEINMMMQAMTTASSSLLLGDVVELQDGQGPVRGGAQQRDVGDVPRRAHEGDHADGHEGRRHQPQDDTAVRASTKRPRRCARPLPARRRAASARS